MTNAITNFYSTPRDVVKLIFLRVPIVQRIFCLPLVCKLFRGCELDSDCKIRFENLTFEDFTSLKERISTFSEKDMVKLVSKLKEGYLLHLIIKVYLSSNYILWKEVVPDPDASPFTFMNKFEQFVVAYHNYKKLLRPLSSITKIETLETSLPQRAGEWGKVFSLPNENWIQLAPENSLPIFLEAMILANKSNYPALRIWKAIYLIQCNADYTQGKNILEDMAAQNNAQAQYALGLLYHSGINGTCQNWTALRYFLKAAEKEYIPAEYAAGIIYDELKNDKEATRWYRKAAEHNHAPSQHCLGWALQEGLGVPKNEQEAVQWYRRSAEQNHPQGQRNLGWMYAHGVGIVKDEREAIRWYMKAARQDNTLAQTHLAGMYENGSGVEKNQRIAFLWYLRAAEKNDSFAQFRLARMYEEGIGVPKDEHEAITWYRKGAKKECTIS